MIKHATASTFVFHQFPDRWRLGLVAQPRLGRHMIVGGHVERDETQAEAALREAVEESGLRVRLLACPTPALPMGYPHERVAAPWWITEVMVPADNHLAEPTCTSTTAPTAKPRHTDTTPPDTPPGPWDYSALSDPALTGMPCHQLDELTAQLASQHHSQPRAGIGRPTQTRVFRPSPHRDTPPVTRPARRTPRRALPQQPSRDSPHLPQDQQTARPTRHHDPTRRDPTSRPDRPPRTRPRANQPTNPKQSPRVNHLEARRSRQHLYW